jgi:hypothetical protein
MTLGDGIRRNVATVSQEERDRLIKCFLKLDDASDPRMVYPDGMTRWDKEEMIHKNAHQVGQDVHDGPAFIPWHRELTNRLERLLRLVDPDISLHYWDWTTDPRGGNGATNLFTAQFMGNDNGDAGPPFDKFESTEGRETGDGHNWIWRCVNGDFVNDRHCLNGGRPGGPVVSNRKFELSEGKPIPDHVIDDKTILTSANTLPRNQQFHVFDFFWLHPTHDYIHEYIGGTIGLEHYSFHDPYVFLIHSNVDRLWSMWQTDPQNAWRLDANLVYGDDGDTSSINDIIEPWAGGHPGAPGLRPWSNAADGQKTGLQDDKKDVKSFKDPSIVTPPKYDTNLS